MRLLLRCQTVLLAATLIGAPILLRAQEATPPPHGPGAPPPPPAGFRPDHPPRSPVVEALDTNSDGVISAEELANATASLKTLDKNGDGQLTQYELRPPPPPHGAEGGGPSDQMRAGPGGEGQRQHHGPEDQARPFPPADHPQAVSGMDAEDGRQPQPPHGAGMESRPIESHVPASARAQRPPRLADDPVATGTGGQAPHQHAAPAPLFDLLDSNHDGVLSEEEIRNAPDVLRKLDRNASGQITREAIRGHAPGSPIN